MSKFKVTSGEFEVIVDEKSFRKAGDLAIRLHNMSNQKSSLGILTLVEKLNRISAPTGDLVVLQTEVLINDNTSGLGENKGQYQKKASNDY